MSRRDGRYIAKLPYFLTVGRSADVRPFLSGVPVIHDELTGRRILPRDQLRHGRYYKGRCQNATVARWDAQRGVFWHWRVKVDRIYLERINHQLNEDFFDVFRVLKYCRVRNSTYRSRSRLPAPKTHSPAIPSISSNLRRRCGGQSPAAAQ